MSLWSSGRLWLLLCLIAACGPARAPVDPSAAVKRAPLTSDRVVVRQSDAPVIDLRVVFEGGSVDDPPGKEGLSYVTALTMLEGRAGELSFAEREALLFPMAAEIEVHVEREQTVFSARVHRDHLARFYPLFRDLLLDPKFDAADFARIRARALSNLTQDLRGADDETLGKELLQAMLFEGHPYAHPELGTERGLAALKVEDLAAQRARIFCRERARVALAGALDPSFAADLTGDLADLQSAACTARRPLPPPSSVSTRRVWIADKPEAASVAISLGLPIAVTRAHPDFAALTLAAAYLGQHRTFAGRLMQKMRGDRGLNYGDYAYAEHFVQDGASRFPRTNIARRQQYFSVWLRPVRPEHAHFALRMAVRELEQFVQEGMSEADFARIQRFVDHYFALFAQAEQERLGYALDDLFYGLDRPHLDALRERVRALTREQVLSAVRRHIVPPRLQVAMVAPRAAELGEALVRGEPSAIEYNVDKEQAIIDEDRLIAAHPLGLARDQVNIVPISTVFH